VVAIVHLGQILLTVKYVIKESEIKFMTGAGFIILVDRLGKFTHPRLMRSALMLQIHDNISMATLCFLWYDIIISRDLRQPLKACLPNFVLLEVPKQR